MKMNEKERTLATKILRRASSCMRTSHVKSTLAKISNENKEKRFKKDKDTLDVDMKLQAMMIFMNTFYFLNGKKVFGKQFKRYGKYYEYMKKMKICYNPQNYQMLHRNVTVSIFFDLKEEMQLRNTSNLNITHINNVEKRDICLYKDSDLLNTHMNFITLLMSSFKPGYIAQNAYKITGSCFHMDSKKYRFIKFDPSVFVVRPLRNRDLFNYFLIH